MVYTNAQAVTNIRLAGPTAGQGRVEVEINGVWGTVCDDQFGKPDAAVVCRMVNSKQNLNIPAVEGVFGSGTGKIYYDSLSCNGQETSLADCGSSPTNDCYHSEDAGVICDDDGINYRLVNGTDANSGRLEVEINGQWGTVCDDEFNTVSAQIVCKKMGLPSSHAYIQFFGQGTGNIWLDDVMCTGTETSIFQCNMTRVGDNDCEHSEDVGIICTDQEPSLKIRLMDGQYPDEGRVEVSINGGQWGTVCDDLWEAAEAQVVCNMLGFTNGTARAVGEAYFGSGKGPIIMDEVECTGKEASLIDCPFGGFGQHDCDHSEDAGVSCNGGRVEQVQVRLVGGSNKAEGRVEVLHNGHWGTVCDDNFDDREARVICHMLGYDNGTSIGVSGAFFGPGTGSIDMDELECKGDEDNIGLCRFDGYGIHDCDHTEDAGVICNAQAQNLTVRLVNGKNANEGRVEVLHGGIWGTVCDDLWSTANAKVVCNMLGLPRHNPYGATNCDHTEDAGVRCVGATESPLRLVGGVGPYEGRLEVFHSGSWGTVCDDQFNVSEAKVACRQLGYPTDTPLVYNSSSFGPGGGKIWLDNLNCQGTESHIDLCLHNAFGVNNCDHSEDVGIVCRITNITLIGPTPDRGRIEVQINGDWGTVCDDHFDHADAKVVCRMLNSKGDINIATVEGVYGPGHGTIFFDELSCKGSETSLADCGDSQFKDCTHAEDAGVICSDGDLFTVICYSGLIFFFLILDSDGINYRLVGGNDANSGRLEVEINGRWGTVCDDEFNTVSARIACKKMGLPSGPIWLDDVICTGTESSLFHCNMSRIGDNNCDHTEDVGIICTDQEPTFNVRLEGGGHPDEGRVEVSINGSLNHIAIFHSGTARAVGEAYFGRGTGPILMDEVECTGTEASLIDCPFGGFGQHDCDHNGSNNEEGRVEVLHNGHWGTVCDDNFDDREARVICHMLGFDKRYIFEKSISFTGFLAFSGTHIAVNGAHFGPGIGSIDMDELECKGDEDNIGLCRFDGYGIHDCDHTEDAGVICNAEKHNLTVRLVNGKNANEGRVEVLYQGVWGTICDDFWGSVNARVICKMLGLPYSQAEGVQHAFFGSGTGPILLDNVRCNGHESSLALCRHNAFGAHNCRHNEDAGVRCVGDSDSTGRWCRSIRREVGGFPSRTFINHIIFSYRSGSEETPIRLVGGVGPYEGRLEVFHQEQWGTVCDDLFHTNEAKVVCKQLGYPTDNPIVTNITSFTAGTGKIWLDNVVCQGNESYIDLCVHNPYGVTNCDHSEDVGIICRSVVIDGLLLYTGVVTDGLLLYTGVVTDGLLLYKGVDLDRKVVVKEMCCYRQVVVLNKCCYRQHTV
ncbi:hypothetical protein KUTeg_000782 [Tegillarca granosa]|uniref:SRCR domain-containing protein n=1 Tax=Tegillarca granosa TaxID=220873 RepID=A0ABQ9FYH8_TEGGR|nr:hypothetical protein KUTeg_000782 [Tegillarca granosa]